MTKTSWDTYFSVERIRTKTPQDVWANIIMPIGLFIIFIMLIYVFYIGVQKKEPEEI